MKRSIAGVLFALTFAALPLAGVFAQSSGIEVTPAIIEETADPGEIITGEINVTNRSDVEVVLYMRARNIAGLTQTGLPLLSPKGETTPYEFAEWVTPDLTGTVFGPRESRPLRYRIVVPDAASPGGHFGVLFASRVAVEPETTGVGLGLQVGTAFNLRVSGAAIEDAFVGSLQTDQSVYKTSQPTVNLSFGVENRGNVLLRPQGAITITSVSGERVATIPINEKRGAVFPGQTRTYEGVWQPDDFTIGRFQAIVSIVYGVEARRTITVTTSFWVLPFKLIFGILALLIAVFIAGYVWLRATIKRRVRELLQNTEASDRARKGVQGALPPEAPTPLPKGALITVGVLLALFIFLLILIFLFA